MKLQKPPSLITIDVNPLERKTWIGW